ncbi:hypothetical protein BH23GEM7_BH23GEM7_20200 [soil metagenome]|nr:hypothetical protein [Gemmatimonadota bacterium]
METETFGFIVVLGLCLFAAAMVANSRLPHGVKLLVYAGLFFRVIGSWTRHEVLFDVYRGAGDARVYHRIGLQYAEGFLNLDFTRIFDSNSWHFSRWWGGQFMYWVSGFVHTITGPSLLAAFLAFSLLAFIGLAGFGVAFRRSFPHVPVTRYLRWIWLFPSLWYWPSSVGKEAIMLLGIGLSIAGFIGRKERINWLLLGLGMFFIFGIRPQVGAVVILSLVLGHWLSIGGRWNVQKAFQGVIILGAGLVGIWFAMQQIGAGGFDIEGVQSYLEDQTGSGSGGGSAIEEVGTGWANIPLALVNIFFRPFPWEAHNLMALFSAIEIWGMWVIVWFRRKTLWQALRHFRSDRLLRVAVPFILVYSVTLGMIIANLGIIARQRVFLFPFFFILVEAVPRVVHERKQARLRAAAPPVYAEGLHAGAVPQSLRTSPHR